MFMIHRLQDSTNQDFIPNSVDLSPSPGGSHSHSHSTYHYMQTLEFLVYQIPHHSHGVPAWWCGAWYCPVVTAFRQLQTLGSIPWVFSSHEIAKSLVEHPKFFLWRSFLDFVVTEVTWNGWRVIVVANFGSLGVVMILATLATEECVLWRIVSLFCLHSGY